MTRRRRVVRAVLSLLALGIAGGTFLVGRWVSGKKPCAEVIGYPGWYVDGERGACASWPFRPDIYSVQGPRPALIHDTDAWLWWGLSGFLVMAALAMLVTVAAGDSVPPRWVLVGPILLAVYVLLVLLGFTQ